MIDNQENPFKKTFYLKQHTPIIHFQHEQDGATLRATELKPKLDRWIKQNTEDLPAEWIQKQENEHTSLKYKLWISADKNKEYFIASSISEAKRNELKKAGHYFINYAPYFADNEFINKEPLEQARKGIMYKNIELTIFSIFPSLLEKVAKALEYVLTYNNFGTRQSKGFGSFSLDYFDEQTFEDILVTRFPKILTYKFKNQPSLEETFKKIDREYKILKSGLAKEKSQLMIYYDDEHQIEWEKQTIKRELVKRKSPEKKDYASDESVKYIRALLGIAELYEYQKEEVKIKIECLDVDESKRKLIERFRSPITFKVFNGNIFMLAQPIPSELYNVTFKFSKGDQHITIATPPKDKALDLEFFLEQFVDQSWEYVNE